MIHERLAVSNRKVLTNEGATTNVSQIVSLAENDVK